MAKPQINTRVQEDVAREIEEFAEENNLSKSDATRRFMLAGMVEFGRLPDSAAPQSGEDDDDGGGGGLFKTVASRLTVAMALLLFGVSNVTLAAANSTYNTWGALASMPFFLLTGLALFGSAGLMLAYILAVATLRDNSAEDETPGASPQGAESTGAGR